MTDAPAQAPDYSQTLFLPKTDFPMRAGLPQKEPEILARWAREGLYAALRETSKGRPKFVLHDGPPYANGNIHMGTALNKVLKDLVVRSRPDGCCRFFVAVRAAPNFGRPLRGFSQCRIEPLAPPAREISGSLYGLQPSALSENRSWAGRETDNSRGPGRLFFDSRAGNEDGRALAPRRRSDWDLIF